MARNENRQCRSQHDVLADIDMALLGLAHLRAQTGVYEYIPAARLTTQLTGIILAPTLLPTREIAHTAAVNQALHDLIAGLRSMGVVDDHD